MLIILKVKLFIRYFSFMHSFLQWNIQKSVILFLIISISKQTMLPSRENPNELCVRWLYCKYYIHNPGTAATLFPKTILLLLTIPAMASFLPLCPRDSVIRFSSIFLLKRFDLGPKWINKNGFANFFAFTKIFYRKVQKLRVRIVNNYSDEQIFL